MRQHLTNAQCIWLGDAYYELEAAGKLGEFPQAWELAQSTFPEPDDDDARSLWLGRWIDDALTAAEAR
jgi:hypothetical protein